MAKRKYKPNWIESLFGGLIKLLISTVAIATVTFILVSGNISLNVSFNKEKTTPASLLERAGHAIALVKTGYNTASEVLK